MKILLDFDGTVVRHKYPHIGEYNEGCREVLQRLHDAGHHIVLNTMRIHGKYENFLAAMKYMKENDLVVHEASNSKKTPKAWDVPRSIETGVLFIDDGAVDTPMNGFMVDWKKIEEELSAHGII
jgi:hypothetical protein